MTDPGIQLAEKAIQEAAEMAKEFLGKIVNPGLEEGAGIIGDTVKFWRFKNQVNILLKAKDFLEKKGVNPTAVLPRTLAPLLEAASLETDETLQDMWANLLASYAKGDLLVQSYPSLLKELTSVEARILNHLHIVRKRENLTGVDALTHGLGKEDICQKHGISAEQYDIVADNLMRLNLVQAVGASGALVGDHPIAIKTNGIIHITALGASLVEACTAFTVDDSKSDAQAVQSGPKQDNVARLG